MLTNTITHWSQQHFGTEQNQSREPEPLQLFKGSVILHELVNKLGDIYLQSGLGQVSLEMGTAKSSSPHQPKET
jgi:hypothetical protein